MLWPLFFVTKLLFVFVSRPSWQNVRLARSNRADLMIMSDQSLRIRIEQATVLYVDPTTVQQNQKQKK